MRSRALGRVAKEYRSDALEADALHFSTDVWSTLAVIVGIGAVWLGQRTGLLWLRYADPLAALVVAAVVIWVGARLGRRTLDALIDAAPAGFAGAGAARRRRNGRRAFRRTCSRSPRGQSHFVDVTISVPRVASFEQVHALSDAVERRVEEIIPADVMVHMEPRAQAGEHLFDAIRAAAQRNGMAIHELSAHESDGRLYVDLHLEVDEHLSLSEAHDRPTCSKTKSAAFLCPAKEPPPNKLRSTSTSSRWVRTSPWPIARRRKIASSRVTWKRSKQLAR